MFPLLHRDKDSDNASVLDQMCVSSITRHHQGFRYDSLTNETKTSSVSI
jgi:hypothetical protein